MATPQLGYDSNAKISQNATDKTKAAYSATTSAENGQGSHAQAAQAHRSAQYANESAGNQTTANKHAAIAAVHEEKATPERAAKNFADTLGAHADKMSKKADMATAAGSAPADQSGYSNSDDVKDPRSPQELHKEAKKAHQKAAAAYGLADMDDKKKYHDGKAVEHSMKMGAA